MLSLKFLTATLAVIGVILHGSLYPYEFQVPPSAVGPVATLLHSWATPPSSYGDLVANLLLYVPFGFFGALVIRAKRGTRLFVMIMAGLLLSVGIELAQFYDAGRVTNMSDVYLNTSGATLGAIAAFLLESKTGYPILTQVAAHPIPVMLLAAMLGYHLFPYVPTIDAHKYWQSVRPLIISPSLSAQPILRYTALWLTTSWLVGSIIGYTRSRLFLPLFMASVFAGKVLIESLVLSFPEVLGAATAFALWLIIGGSQRGATLLTTAVLCGTIVAGRLEPYHFEQTARAFGWLPFRGFLDGSLRVNTMAFMEKFFLYGSLVWLSTRTGFPLWLATLLVALLLFITSIAELYLPGRSAETTDAIMALMVGLIIAPLRTQAYLDSRGGSAVKWSAVADDRRRDLQKKALYRN
jgi:VanZ family protein